MTTTMRALCKCSSFSSIVNLNSRWMNGLKMRYHQYADGTHLYISSPGDPSDMISCPLKVSEGCGDLHAGPQASTESWSNRVAFGSRDLGIWGFISFSSGWGCTTPYRFHALSGGSPSLTTPALRVVVRRALAKLYMHHLHSFLDCGALQTVTHVQVTSQLNYCNVLYMRVFGSHHWCRMQLMKNAPDSSGGLSGGRCNTRICQFACGSNSRCWSLALISLLWHGSMVHLRSRHIPMGTSPPHMLQHKKPSLDFLTIVATCSSNRSCEVGRSLDCPLTQSGEFCQRILADGVQKKSLICCGPYPLE